MVIADCFSVPIMLPLSPAKLFVDVFHRMCRVLLEFSNPPSVGPFVGPSVGDGYFLLDQLLAISMN
jgi:hypothetical protein